MRKQQFYKTIAILDAISVLYHPANNSSLDR